MWQGAHESVERRREVARLAQPRLADRIANLLLVVPALGVLARQVEPDRRGRGAGPIDRAAQRVWIERLKERRHLLAGQPQHIAQQARADPTGRLDPLGVLAIDECDQIVPARERGLAPPVAIASPRAPADIPAQEMPGQILDRPAGADCWRGPLVIREA